MNDEPNQWCVAELDEMYSGSMLIIEPPSDRCLSFTRHGKWVLVGPKGFNAVRLYPPRNGKQLVRFFKWRK